MLRVDALPDGTFPNIGLFWRRAARKRRRNAVFPAAGPLPAGKGKPLQTHGECLMNVTCPQCNTVYRLPDEKVKSGVKLRCSVCRHIFALNVEDAPVLLDRPEPAPSRGEKPAPAADTLDFGPSEKRSPVSDYGSEGTLSLGGSSSSGSGGGLSLAMDEPRRERPAGERGMQGLRLDGAGGAEAFGGLDMPRRKRSILPRIFSFVFCVALCAGAWWMWGNTPYLDGLKGLVAPYFGLETADASDPLSLVSKLELRDVRQYQVKNEKLGNLIIIEGKVMNNFPTPRELIRLEAELYDASGNMLVSQQQLAGSSISSFQLEVLDKEELDKALNSKLDIVSSNVNVLPGSEVPFTVVFVDPPAGASDYKVRIAEASLPKGPGNLTE